MDLKILLVLCLGSLLLVGLTGCGESADDDTADDDDTVADDDDSAGDPVVDNDGDGHPSDTDCNDEDAAIHPGADELCDGTDRNCDGDSEQGAVDAPTWYEDIDGDGYGVETNSQDSCNQPHGYSAYSGDCNDAEPSYHPGAAEADCTDPNDYNCDQSTGYADLDNDGVAACEDCNDDDNTVNSAATEVCNTVDDDCDGLVDEAGAGGESTWYLDADGDGYGRTTVVLAACNQPPAYVGNSDDCDDLDTNAFPGATEVCDEIDNNCTGGIDEGAAAPVTWYADFDGDGIGNTSNALVACAAPTGYVGSSGDCDDLDASSFPADSTTPAGTEVCDGADNNCDQSIDEGVTSTFYGDSDGDGYGDPGTLLFACFQPAGASNNNQDCDDSQPSVHPGGIEVCDGFDNDCDNTPDDGALDAITWYVDSDNDGAGDPLTGVSSCSQIIGLVSNDGDCNDNDPDNYPGNTESCDGADENCNNAVDEGYDVDTDGVTTCGSDGSLGTADDDCDDGNPLLFPGNPEECDGLDQDCDTVVDNGFDQDNDGVSTCGPDGAPSTFDDDCDDGDPANWPGLSESCDGQDNNCDQNVDEGFDGDSDTHTSCGPDGIAGTADDDCNDGDATVNTAASEICDGQDNNCDQNVDEGFLGQGTACPAGDCAAILAVGDTSGGPKWIDPDGAGPIEVSCDQNTDNGGWTLVFHVFEHSGLSENDFISLFGHNLWTDESWNYAGSSITSGLGNGGLVYMDTQGAMDIERMSGRWADLRMGCSQSNSDSNEQSFAQVNGYSTTNGNWNLLGGASNGTSYSVDPALVSTGQSTIWHDNEPNSHNSGHYMCDVTNSGSGAAQFGFCYTDFLNSPNSSEHGDSIVAIAFGTVFGDDSWSSGFSAECGDMGTGYLSNSGTFSIWVR